MPASNRIPSAPRPARPDGIRVLLVDDHEIVRIGVRTVLSRDPRFQVVGEAETASGALDQALRLKPDVVLLDLRLPDRSGVDVCRELKQRGARPSVLCLTSYADERTILAAMDAGADGYLLKEVDGLNIGDAIETIARGGSVMDPRVTRRFLSAVRDQDGGIVQLRRQLERISPQERRVMDLVANGRTNKEIAEALKLRAGTVRNYLATIFQKLGVARRAEAVALWIRANEGSDRRDDDPRNPI